jgi:DNA-binding transcriptional MerR regulator
VTDALGIGQLAKRGGVGIDTVRYYERNGLLAPRTRLASGYRRYGDSELARLRFIRRAQGLGFTLKEIKQLLVLSAQRDVGRAHAEIVKPWWREVENALVKHTPETEGEVTLPTSVPWPLDYRGT